MKAHQVVLISKFKSLHIAKRSALQACCPLLLHLFLVSISICHFPAALFGTCTGQNIILNEVLVILYDIIMKRICKIPGNQSSIYSGSC